MFQFPQIPSWDALHPLVIHFPIALLLIAPIFVLLGALLQPAKGRPYLIAATVLLLLGTAGTFIAVETGEAAGEIAERTAGVQQVLETHESLAERTRAVFSILSIIFIALVAFPMWVKKADNRMSTTVLPLAFLVLYSAGILLLLNTAHNGGRLVHEFASILLNITLALALTFLTNRGESPYFVLLAIPVLQAAYRVRAMVSAPAADTNAASRAQGLLVE